MEDGRGDTRGEILEEGIQDTLGRDRGGGNEERRKEAKMWKEKEGESQDEGVEEEESQDEGGEE